MEKIRTRPFVRALGASIVALALVGVPLTQSATADLAGFSGSGTGFALRVVLDLSGLPDAAKAPIETAYGTFRDALPAEAQALLPESFPFTLDQRFIETLADMGTANKAQAFLSRGLVELTEKAEASSSGESDQVNSAAHSLPSEDLPVLNVSAGELLASVADGPSVTGSGSLASVSATLELVSSLFPAELQTAFDDVTAAINDAISTAQGTLDDVLGDVAGSLVDQVAGDDVLGGLLDQAGLGDVLGGTDPVADATALATELVNALQLSTVTDLLAGSLASVDGLDNDAKARKTADSVTSSASSKIESVDALGLLNASAISLKSHSEAAGTAGSAKNDSDCEIADVKVGGDDGISLDGDTLTVAGTEIPVPVDQVDAVKGVVDDVLSALGVVGDVGLCDVEGEADQDGTSAAQRVSAFHVELALAAPEAVGQLIGAGDELVRLVIDPTVESAAAAQPAPTVSDPEVSLPRTGAPFVATLFSGLALAGAALVLRRRIR